MEGLHLSPKLGHAENVPCELHSAVFNALITALGWSQMQ